SRPGEARVAQRSAPKREFPPLQCENSVESSHGGGQNVTTPAPHPRRRRRGSAAPWRNSIAGTPLRATRRRGPVVRRGAGDGTDAHPAQPSQQSWRRNRPTKPPAAVPGEERVGGGPVRRPAFGRPFV